MSEHNENNIFALDIGTRSVIGIVGRQEGDIFNVLATEREEYSTRAVVDGQIEDILQTARVAGVVKSRLEEKLGQALTHVHIAAAGRILRTVTATSTLTVPDGPIDTVFVSELTQSALRNAFEELSVKDKGHTFLCVGHTVKKYTLDGYDLSTILEHKGNEAKIDLIATFLPKEVVESLYATMSKIDLTVSGMTLEPIAAMNAIIPDDIRKLNLALCDIGAGTSDIAICKDGSVVSYTMATVAGDEVTEAVMQSCLVDFVTGEQIKWRLAESLEGDVTYINILGFEETHSAAELYSRINGTIEELAKEISQSILEDNSGQPAAVFLVGGGSKTPTLRELVAETMGLDLNRVAVGSNVHIKRMAKSDEDIFGPEYATPLGIALTAIKNAWGDSFSIEINGKKQHLMNSFDSSVLGVLQMAGYKYSQLIARAGTSIYYELDGQNRIARGGLPTPSEILLNGAIASLSQAVKVGDVLTVKTAQNGEDAALTLRQAVAHMEDRTSRRFKVNGKPATLQYNISSGDVIESEIKKGKEDSPSTKRSAKQDTKPKKAPRTRAQKAPNPITPPPMVESIVPPTPEYIPPSPEPEYMPLPHKQPALPTQPTLEPDYILTDQGTLEPLDEIELLNSDVPLVPADSALSPIAEEAAPPKVGITVNLNGNLLTLPYMEAYHFLDLLPYSGIDEAEPKDFVVQLINGSTAAYLDEIKHGDIAEIYWEDN